MRDADNLILKGKNIQVKFVEDKKSRYKGKKGFGNDNFNNLGKDRGQNEFRI